MLVDSNFERRTFAELRRLQQFLSARQGIRMEIEKPMLDIGTGEDLEDQRIAAREPCIPDFVLRTDPGGAGAATVIIETMGFPSESYRGRKEVMHKTMTRVLSAPVLIHDFHFPSVQTQDETGGSGRRPVGRLWEEMTTKAHATS